MKRYHNNVSSRDLSVPSILAIINNWKTTIFIIRKV